MLTIDGAAGEGGGQVLRTALSLALVTGQAFRIERVRANRPDAGLGRQDLASVEAALRVCGGRLKGATLGAASLTFEPGPVRPGNYTFAIGRGGSATLVLQTILPALALAGAPSRVALEGGTHNPATPPFDFLSLALFPLLRRMGPALTARLERWGFAPTGGGRFEVAIEPVARLRPLQLPERGRLKACRLRGVAAGHPRAIAARAVETAYAALGLQNAYVDVRQVQSAGAGHALLIELISEHVSEVVAGFGENGLEPEEMARAAVREARDYLDADVPVGPHLADQLLVPLALAGAGEFVTVPPTRHTTTNLDLVRQFLAVDLHCEPQGSGRWRISVG